MLSNLQAQWARLLVGSLVDAGVRDAVLSPGSRSTPFVLEAARHKGLRCHDVIDERSAAYFALGQARVSGRPSLLVCTSGTAGANYLPAVIEAEMARIPLLVLTADRPVDLVGCGSNQTIDQLKLYGDHVRGFFDLGQGDARPRALRALRRTTSQAYLASVHPDPGPVHLNARAVKPLEPREAKTENEKRLEGEVDTLLQRPAAKAPIPRLVPDPADLDELAASCRDTSRGLIVAGPAPLSQAVHTDTIVQLALRTGYPILADASSQLRYRGARKEDAVFVDAFGLLLGNAEFRQRYRPEIILQIGRAPTPGSWELFVEQVVLEQAVAGHWLIGAGGWNDPQSTATHRLATDVGTTLEGLLERLDSGLVKTEWTDAFADAEALAQRLINEELATTVTTEATELTEGGVARQLIESLPRDALFMVGNSLPIRQVDLYGRGGKADVLVASQRGTSGIDGVTSGALGSATAGDRPTALLIGDVSFLHDLSALAAAHHVRVPMALVVVQNQGGRIFEMLPVASHLASATDTLDHWLTPHQHDLSHAAALFNLPFVRAKTSGALNQALKEALKTPGVTVIEAIVPPHGAIEQNRRLSGRLQNFLAI